MAAKRNPEPEVIEEDDDELDDELYEDGDHTQAEDPEPDEEEEEDEPAPPPPPVRKKVRSAAPAPPASNKPAAKAPAAPVTKPDWGAILEDLSRSSSDYIYLKPGRTRLRLVNPPGQPPYAETDSTYRGKVRTKYVMLAIMAGSDASKEDGREPDNSIKGVILSKTCFRSIVGLLSEGYDLFDPARGYGITIVKSGTGRDTNFSVMPSPKPKPIDPAVLADAPDIREVAKAYAEQSAKRGSEKGDGDGDDEASSNDW